MKKIYLSLILLAIPCYAHALDYANGNWRFNLDADGMLGLLEKKDKNDIVKDDKAIVIDDWDIKGQVFYNLNETQRIGAVYSIDAACVEDDEYAHDAFILFEDKDIGRSELGLTHSIARKMGLGLPDVGYLRINNKSILNKKLDLKNVLISDTTATTGHDALRINLATRATRHGQYGFSIAGGGDEYKYTMDIAYKIKRPAGKLKAAYSLALSYMDHPDKYEENSFTPSTTADWRGQIALGVNLQYNSWVFGTSARMIYDHNPIGQTADGFVVGSGVSYDLLQSSVSFNYMFSDTNVWNHKEDGEYIHTMIASFRYKYSPNTSLFMSGGLTDKTPFFAVGLKSGF